MSEVQKPSTAQRKVKNILVNKQMQYKMGAYFVAFSVSLIGVMLFFMNHYISEIRRILTNVPGLPMTTQLAIDTRLQSILAASILFLLIAVTFSIVYGIIISHRIAGPQFAILKYIEALRAGRLDEKRQLRPYDELRPVMAALHELADDLKKKASR